MSIFGDESEEFSTFMRALLALFKLVVGEPWVETIPAFGDDGSLNHAICLYVVSYVLVVTWTLLQVWSLMLLLTCALSCCCWACSLSCCSACDTKS